MEYQFESIGPMLSWVALVFLLVFALAAVAALVGIASLPGWIARRRQHPQFAAINMCGWFGLPTGFLWVVAIVWAYVDWPSGPSTISETANSDRLIGLREQVDLLETAIAELEESVL